MMYYAVLEEIEKVAGVVGQGIDQWHANNPIKSRLSSMIGGSRQRHRNQAAAALRTARSAPYLRQSSGRITQNIMRKRMAEGGTPASAINYGNMTASMGRAAGRSIGHIGEGIRSGIRSGVRSFGQALLDKQAGTLGNQINQFAGPKSVSPIRKQMAGMLRRYL